MSDAQQSCLRVECYDGYRDDEKPRRFIIAERGVIIDAALDRTAGSPLSTATSRRTAAMAVSARCVTTLDTAIGNPARQRLHTLPAMGHAAVEDALARISQGAKTCM